MNRTSLAVLSLFSFLLLFSSVSVAQLGEVAGQPHFNVSIGGSNTIQITVINEATYPLPITVILPTLTSQDANAITPALTAYPMSAVIPAGKELNINLTVNMPGGTNKPGYSWSGILQVVTAPNSSSGGGATIIEGVAKIVSISATAHVTTIYDYLLPAGIIVAIVIVVAAIFVARRKGAPGARPAAAKARARKMPGKTAAGARRKARPRTRKGKGKRRPSRTRARTTRRRRRR